MKWSLTYTFLATMIFIMGLIEKKVVYMATSIFIYGIVLIWLIRKN